MSSWRSLETARRRLYLDRMPEARRKRIDLHPQLSVIYRDQRLHGFDAATLIEVIERLEPPWLPSFARVVFEQAEARTVVVTTQNAEYNGRLPDAGYRTAEHQGPSVRMDARAVHGMGDGRRELLRVQGFAIVPVGSERPVFGAPTQMGVFTK